MRREKRGYYIAVEGRGEREVGREECGGGWELGAEEWRVNSGESVGSGGSEWSEGMRSGFRVVLKVG